METNIIDRMSKLGIRQVDLLTALRGRGIEVQPPRLSNALRGICTEPKALMIVNECEKIITEYETLAV